LHSYSEPLANGFIEHVTVAAPAAATDFVYLLPNGFSYEVQSIFFTLTTDANVISRFVRLHYLDAAIVIAENTNELAMTATSTWRISAAIGLSTQAAAATSERSLPLPHRYIMPGNFSIRSLIISLQAADQLSDIEITLKKWVNQTV
jgi:hypothetical protein